MSFLLNSPHRAGPGSLARTVLAAAVVAAVAAVVTGCAGGTPPAFPSAAMDNGARPSGAPMPAPPPSMTQPSTTTSSAAASPATRPGTDASTLVPPPPAKFEDAVARAGNELLKQVATPLGSQPRALVIDPLIDANTGGQTVSTARMGTQLEAIVKRRYAAWKVEPLTRQSLAQKPLLLIGTLTPINTERVSDTPPDAYRVWLTLIDLDTNKVVAKQLDRATLDSVDPEPLKYYADSPTWHKDKTVLGYINSCQVKTNIGDSADMDYLSRLPGAAVVNEAIIAYSGGKVVEAQKLYIEAQPLTDPGDLRVLNGLYLTNWQLGNKEAAKQAFDKLVDSGLEQKKLPLKLLFQPGKTVFNQVGDLPQQYRIWIGSVAQEADKSRVCVRVVGHTSRTGSASINERLSRQRAEVVQKMLEQDNRSLSTRLSAAGMGSKEALVGLGTDDLRDALDRRVEFRVVDCI
jgi:outer membrane protein OmpA-like peptidoglycan-associated protein